MDTFTLVIDGSRLGGAETTAQLKLEIQGAPFIKDDADNQFVFPHESAIHPISIGLPFSIPLPTDVPAGSTDVSTQVGYLVTLTTKYGGHVGPVPFAAPAAGSTIVLENVAERIVTPVSDLAGYLAATEAARDAAIAAAARAGARVTSVNGNPGDESGAVLMNLNSLLGVDIAAVEDNDDGTPVAGTGPQAGDYLLWDPATGEWVNGPVTGFAPEGWVPPYTLRGLLLAAGDVPPADLPDDVLLFDETKPSAPLFELVNPVASSGPALTLPGPATATLHDVTLTANCTLTFPTPVAGSRFRLLLRQDATGSRTVTWPTGTKWAGGTAPTLSTAAGAEDLLQFVSIGGMSWRQVGTVDRYAGTPQPGPTPTVRGVFSANAGASNTLTSVATTLPTGLANGDLAYMAVAVDGTSKTMVTPPSGWTMVDGPVAAGSQTTWLFRKSLTTGDSGAAVSSGVMSANGRPSLTGVVVAGGTTTGEVVVNNQDITTDTTLDVPAVTPGVGNSLLVHLASTRTVQGPTTPQNVTAAAGWTERLEHHEGRWDGTQVNFGGYVETKALTGQGNVAQTATTATYADAATERSYVVAVPPPVA